MDGTEIVENRADPLPAVTVSYAQTLDGRLATVGATVLRLPADTEGHVDLEALLAELYASGVRSVLRLLLWGDHQPKTSVWETTWPKLGAV